MPKPTTLARILTLQAIVIQPFASEQRAYGGQPQKLTNTPIQTNTTSQTTVLSKGYLLIINSTIPPSLRPKKHGDASIYHDHYSDATGENDEFSASKSTIDHDGFNAAHESDQAYTLSAATPAQR